MLYRREPIGWFIVAMLLSGPLALGGASPELHESRTVIAHVEVGPTRVDWLPKAGDYERLILTVAGPGDLYVRREFEAGHAPFLSLSDAIGERLPDGDYTYEFRAISRRDPATREIREKVQSLGYESFDSGYLTIEGGRFALRDSEPHSASRSSLKPTTADQTIPEDLIVTGNACIGSDCVTVDDYYPLKLNSEFLGILFDDVTGISPNRDWAIDINNSLGAGEWFAVRDLKAGTVPFKIEGDAPQHALYVRSNGNLGLGTSTPAVRLDVKANASGAAAGRIQSSSATGYPGWEYLGETGAAVAYAGLVNSSQRFQISTISGNYPIVLFTNGLEHLRIDPDGDVGINCDNPTSDLVIASSFGCNAPSSSINAGSTSFTTSSSRTLKEKLSPVKIPDILEKMAGVGVYTYDFKGGPKERIGLMAEDFHQIFQRGSDKMLDGQEVEVALWLAVQELTAQNKKLAAQNKEISARLAELEARLTIGPVNKP